jgi:hypothetical protein
LGGVCVSRQWYPDACRTAGDYGLASAASFGLDIAQNVFSEFWPDLKKRLHR